MWHSIYRRRQRARYFKRKEVIESNEEVEYIKKIIRSNGDIKYYKVTKIPITNGLENVVGVLSIIKDKSHKYELERLRDRFFQI